MSYMHKMHTRDAAPLIPLLPSPDPPHLMPQKGGAPDVERIHLRPCPLVPEVHRLDVKGVDLADKAAH